MARGGSFCRLAARVLLLSALWSVAATVGAGDTIETSGHVLRVAIPAAALALTVKRSDRPGRHGLYKSFAANVASTWLLKELIDKRKPDGYGNDAFPSGHASMAFQGAAFIHRRYGLLEAGPAYALAGYVGWTRLRADRHDATDVLAGAALGIASSFLFNRPLGQGASAAALVDRDFVGVRLHVVF